MPDLVGYEECADWRESIINRIAKLEKKVEELINNGKSN